MDNETKPETFICPWCGAERKLEPEKGNSDREAAYCGCTGNRKSFFSRPVKHMHKTIKKVEGE